MNILETFFVFALACLFCNNPTLSSISLVSAASVASQPPFHVYSNGTKVQPLLVPVPETYRTADTCHGVYLYLEHADGTCDHLELPNDNNSTGFSVSTTSLSIFVLFDQLASVAAAVALGNQVVFSSVCSSSASTFTQPRRLVRRLVFDRLSTIGVTNNPNSALTEVMAHTSSSGSVPHSYIYVEQSATLEEADKYCSKRVDQFGKKGYLATITSSSENDFVRQLVKRGGTTALLGGSDVAQEGTFRWVTGPEGREDNGRGKVFTYTRWYSGEPNDSNNREDYMEMYTSGFWNDRASDRSSAFVCEFGGLDSVSVTGMFEEDAASFAHVWLYLKDAATESPLPPAQQALTTTLTVHEGSAAAIFSIFPTLTLPNGEFLPSNLRVERVVVEVIFGATGSDTLFQVAPGTTATDAVAQRPIPALTSTTAVLTVSNVTDAMESVVHGYALANTVAFWALPSKSIMNPLGHFVNSAGDTFAPPARIVTAKFILCCEAPSVEIARAAVTVTPRYAPGTENTLVVVPMRPIQLTSSPWLPTFGASVSYTTALSNDAVLGKMGAYGACLSIDYAPQNSYITDTGKPRYIFPKVRGVHTVFSNETGFRVYLDQGVYQSKLISFLQDLQMQYKTYYSEYLTVTWRVFRSAATSVVYDAVSDHFFEYFDFEGRAIDLSASQSFCANRRVQGRKGYVANFFELLRKTKTQDSDAVPMGLQFEQLVRALLLGNRRAIIHFSEEFSLTQLREDHGIDVADMVNVLGDVGDPLPLKGRTAVVDGRAPLAWTLLDDEYIHDPYFIEGADGVICEYGDERDVVNKVYEPCTPEAGFVFNYT
eukprot:PhM_4_TR8103/c0_g1_i1/m.14891